MKTLPAGNCGEFPFRWSRPATVEPRTPVRQLRTAFAWKPLAGTNYAEPQVF